MLRRLMKYCAICCLMSATAFAGAEQSSKPDQTGKAIPRKQSHRSCYLLFSGSLIPQPCDRLVGPEPSTAIPMDIIGGYPPRVAPPGEVAPSNAKQSTAKRRSQMARAKAAISPSR